MKIITLCSIIILLFTSCQNDPKESKIKKYFDLKTIIEQQIKQLDTQKPTVKKIITIGQTTENQTIKISDWTKELELFTQADLNKPAYLNSYLIDSTADEIKYTIKTEEHLPVKYLTILRPNGSGIRIEALINTSNYLYESEKRVTLILEKNHLIAYQIDGFQKVVFGDKKSFKINGTVVR
ncbi:MAG: hypothetical protein MUF58_20720 [Arcicella sp.]|jgi:hypothetical protein|nr:hypothetical protein [Arcicella sp.]